MPNNSDGKAQESNMTKEFHLKEQEWSFIKKYIPNLFINSKILQKNNEIMLMLDILEQERVIDELQDLFISIGLKKL